MDDDIETAVAEELDESTVPPPVACESSCDVPSPVEPESVIEAADVGLPTSLLPPESVFTPIRSEESPAVDSNEDSNSRRMSREDIETMEIMQNEDKLSTEAHIEKNDIEAPTVQLKRSEKNSNSTPSSLTPRSSDRDPILKQKNTFSSISATDLIEYQWPPDDSGDYYMLQEQVSTFLAITSFKRKYPEIERRKLDPQEVKYLTGNMLVSEVQVTLGLTAVRSRDVCDLMIKEYPEKYHEYTQILDERQKQTIKNKHMQYSAPTVEKSQMPNYLKKAMKQVSLYNSRLNRQRKDEFAVYYDMQTNVLQFPQSKVRKADPQLTKPSLYPCALIPGQFQDFYQEYTACELNYMPINTVLYGPPAPIPDKLDENTSGSEHHSDAESVESASAKSEKSNQVVIEKDSVQDISGVQPQSPKEDQLRDETTETADSGSATENQVEEIEKDEKDTANAEVPEEVSKSIMEIDEDPDKHICGICLKDETCNKKGEPEDLISCSQCDNHGHPSCLDMSKDLVSVIVTYNWQCLECKTCTYCSKPHHEDKMMFCDRCDRGYHTFCVGLRNLPSGLWMCPTCTRSDPDFAKRGGRRRGSSSTPRRRKANTDAPETPSDTPQKPKRKRRTKKEMEEAREKEKQDKEEKKRDRKEEKRKRKKAEKEAKEKAEKGDDDLNESSILEDKDSDKEEDASEDVSKEVMDVAETSIQKENVVKNSTEDDLVEEKHTGIDSNTESQKTVTNDDHEPETKD